MQLRAWQLHAVDRALTNYYWETWSHGKKEGKAKKKKPQRNSYMKEKFPISYLPKVWKRKGKARKEKAAKKQI